jgi:hypothetical protein
MIGAVVLAFVISNAISLLSLVMSRMESARLKIELSGIRSELKNLREVISALRLDLPGVSEQRTSAGEEVKVQESPVKHSR